MTKVSYAGESCDNKFVIEIAISDDNGNTVRLTACSTASNVAMLQGNIP